MVGCGQITPKPRETVLSCLVTSKATVPANSALPRTYSHINSHGHVLGPQPHIHSRNHTPAPHHFTLASLLLYRVVLVSDTQAEGQEDELAVGVEDRAGKDSHHHGHESRRAAPTVGMH